MICLMARILGCFLIHRIVVDGLPIRGNYPWTVILCKFYDEPNEPRTPEYFESWILDDHTDGSMAKYLRETSNGLYTINGSTVVGWFTMPYRKQAMRYLAEKDEELRALYPSPGAIPMKVYHKTKQLCVETAASNGVQLTKNVISVINDDNVAMFCTQEGILLTPNTLATAALAHELVHSLHIGHSYSDRSVQIFPYSTFGEYDDLYDLMSTSNAYMHSTFYGKSGPGLNGPHLDYLGWLPMDRIVYFGKNGQTQGEFTLSSHSVPHGSTAGPLMIYIPYDRDNKLKLLAVTLRTPDGVDRGIPQSAVLIHRLKEQQGHIFSYVITNDKSWRHEWFSGETFRVYLNEEKQMSIKIEILDISPGRRTATIRINSSFRPTTCGSGEVQRKATASDEVCTTMREMERILQENRLAWTLTSLSGVCRENFVKREATPDDNVCVTPARAETVRVQNARHQFYKKFYDSPNWGLNACVDGYVWRGFDQYDYVCIPEDKMQLYENVVTRRKHTIGCPDNFKRRYAYPGDMECVLMSDQNDYFTDPYHGQYRLSYRKFFNGVDTLE